MEGQSFGQPEEETKEEVKKEKQGTAETEFPLVNPRFKGIESADEPETIGETEIKEEIKKMDEEAQEKARDVAREKIREAKKHAKDFDPEKEAVLPEQKQKIEGQEIKERETEEVKSPEPESAKTREKEEAAEQKTEEPKQEIPAGKAEKQGGMEAERQRYERAREWNPIKKIMDRFDVRLRLDSRALKNKDKEIKELKAEVFQKQPDIQNFEKVVKETEKDFQWLIETGTKRGRDVSGLQRESERSRSDYEQAKSEAQTELRRKDDELAYELQNKENYEALFRDSLNSVTLRIEKKIEANSKSISDFREELKFADDFLKKAEKDKAELEEIIPRLKKIAERKGMDKTLKETFKRELADYKSEAGVIETLLKDWIEEKKVLGDKIAKLEKQNDEWRRETERKKIKYSFTGRRMEKESKKKQKKEKMESEESSEAVESEDEKKEEQKEREEKQKKHRSPKQQFEDGVKSAETVEDLLSVMKDRKIIEIDYPQMVGRIRKTAAAAEKADKKPDFGFVKPRFVRRKLEKLYAEQK